MKTKNRITKLAPLMVLMGISFSGCTMHQPSFGPTHLRNKITVAETVERLELYAGPNGLKLSARDQDAVSNFLHQYSRQGQGPLYVNIPSNALNAAGITQAQTALRARMQNMGINPDALQAGQYVARPGSQAPIVVSYRRLTTQPIECASVSGLTFTSTNQPYGGFGCAQTANFAALIDDPRQLLSPYELDVLRANRRVDVLDKYVKGEVTAAEKPGDQEINAQEGGSSSN